MCVCFDAISASTLPEAGSVEVVPVAAAREPSTADSRVGATQLSVQAKADILLRARFHEGDAVVHQERGYQGIVTGLRVDDTGAVWVSVQRTWKEGEVRGEMDFRFFCSHEEILDPLDEREEAGPAILQFPAPADRPEQDDVVIAYKIGAPAS